jgi:hypothetical protein
MNKTKLRSIKLILIRLWAFIKLKIRRPMYRGQVVLVNEYKPSKVAGKRGRNSYKYLPVDEKPKF